MLKLIPAGCVLLAGKASFAETAMVDEQSEVARSVGYRTLAANIDLQKYPNYRKGQQCDTCQLFMPSPTDASSGECPVFQGQRVAAAGWCSAYA
ncbi:high-potential iron-sulfur protein [Leeia oryzae]|uniref:high-potential iron-sulfur protein n=1 Tax=Leeia oryzae TaxID=356662 RepID=UPI000476C982|nr:high-potential iron-sulfur protein [Leeia oryzae]